MRPVAKKEIWALVIALIFAMAFDIIPTYLNNPINPFQDNWFAGIDTYMRMVRVQDWWDGGSWYTTFSPRSNWPHGEILHWTRPLDVMLVVLAAPLAPFLGMHQALYVSGVFISPLMFLATYMVMLWGSRPFLDARGRIILVLVLTFQPILHFYFVAARPDHHSLILFCFAAVLSLFARHALNPGDEWKTMIWAGIAAGIGVWISIESLSIELYALLALGVIWLWRGGDEIWLLALRRFSITSALTLVLAIMIERPPTGWFTSVEFDRLSTVHVFLFLLIAIGIEGLWRTRAIHNQTIKGRSIAGIVAAVGAGLALDSAYPDFFKGPFGAAMDPRLVSLWLDKINEFQPLISSNPNTIFAAVIIFFPIIWLVVWGVIVCKASHHRPQNVNLLITLGTAVILFLPLAMAQSRWGAHMGVSVAFGWVLLLQWILDWRGGPLVGANPSTPILRVPLFLFVATIHIFVASAFELSFVSEKETAPKSCKWIQIAPYLNSKAFANGNPQVILSFIHQGPEIMYRTQHRVIGTPYHRNTKGLLDSFTAFTALNEAESKAIFIKRGVDYMVLCKETAEENFFLDFKGKTLMRNITTGNLPTWLTPVSLPNGLAKDFRVLRFNK